MLYHSYVYILSIVLAQWNVQWCRLGLVVVCGACVCVDRAGCGVCSMCVCVCLCLWIGW